MSQTKNWMMDMEEHVWDALKGGWTSLKDVKSYVKERMDTVDESYVEQIFHELDQEFQSSEGENIAK